MTSKNYIKDIQMFINEAYSDNEPLQENQIKSKQVFNDYCNIIKQDLDRLEKLEKAFDKACESLDWDCPEGQNLIDDFIDYFDCENCKNTEKECWKKYFLKEVLEDE